MAHTAKSKRGTSSRKFLLSFHPPTRCYYKTIKGKRHYFGRDKDEALEQWLKQKDDLLAGKKPSSEQNIVTVQYACNFLLTHKKRLLDAEELSIRTYSDIKTMCNYTVEHFGKNRSVESRLTNSASFGPKW